MLGHETSERINRIIIPLCKVLVIVHEFVQEDCGCAIGATNFNEASGHVANGLDAVCKGDQLGRAKHIRISTEQSTVGARFQGNILEDGANSSCEARHYRRRFCCSTGNLRLQRGRSFKLRANLVAQFQRLDQESVPERPKAASRRTALASHSVRRLLPAEDRLKLTEHLRHCRHVTQFAHSQFALGAKELSPLIEPAFHGANYRNAYQKWMSDEGGRHPLGKSPC